MRFVDEVTLTVKSGDGGNGAVAFRRERRRPRGGPSGGDGGRGGDVVLIADRNLGTLLDLRSYPRIEARRGQDGQGKDCHGKSAGPFNIRVPVGTTVIDTETETPIGDLTTHGQRLVVAAGGDGGRGNMHFATASNRAPRKSEPGFPGETRTIRLELKLLADVGIIGMPNVGKSTLVSRLSAARPKIADYPFTTLVPNLGVVELGPGETFVMADIPGIVEGAADGAGLGLRFLRHVQRTAVLLHLLAPGGAEDADVAALLEDFETLRREAETFDAELISRPTVVALNKADLPSVRDVEGALRSEFEGRGHRFAVISAATGQGLPELTRQLGRLVQEQTRQRQSEPENDDQSDESSD